MCSIRSCKKNGCLSCRTLNQAGFTLVEMIVVMAIFIVVIIIATDSFNTILSRSNLLSRSAESNIEGVVGLEMFRHDLNQAGFGLPWEFDAATPPQYNEAAVAPANNYNDAPTGVPRAFLAGNNLEGAGILEKTDYLVLKGSSLASDNASQRWSYVNYSSVGSSKPKIWSSANLSAGDRVIVLRRAFTSTGYVNRLVYDTSTFYTTYSQNGFATGTFTPAYPQESFYLYGISTGNPRMPFNRSDYFVKRPASIPNYCADNTGVLYKSNVLQNNGTLDEIPVLDCVADMQVVFGWDLDEDGTVEAYSDADGTTVNGGTSTVVKNTMKDSELIRNRLKLVKIYLLVQDGRKDPNFRNEKDILVGSTDEQSLTKKYDVAAINSNKWTNYRWKIYRIVVSPKNLTLK
ncbi:MAG: PilW family protein [Geobacteraceae bacterium]|nr:PilW family protein [Geobacteraceae bacterium]